MYNILFQVLNETLSISVLGYIPYKFQEMSFLRTYVLKLRLWYVHCEYDYDHIVNMIIALIFLSLITLF